MNSYFTWRLCHCCTHANTTPKPLLHWHCQQTAGATKEQDSRQGVGWRMQHEVTRQQTTQQEGRG
jgi:hypothetical protein